MMLLIPLVTSAVLKEKYRNARQALWDELLEMYECQSGEDERSRYRIHRALSPEGKHVVPFLPFCDFAQFY